MFKKDAPKTKEDLFSMLFWKNLDLVEPALKIYERIKNNEQGIQCNCWQELCQEFNLKVNEYYSIMYGLHSSGLIRKESSVWLKSDKLLIKLEGCVEVIEQLSGVKSALRRV